MPREPFCKWPVNNSGAEAKDCVSGENDSGGANQVAASYFGCSNAIKT
jgi:hypothetical protein